MQFMRLFENITFCSLFTNRLRPFRDFNHHSNQHQPPLPLLIGDMRCSTKQSLAVCACHGIVRYNLFGLFAYSADSTQNINTNWKTCEIHVERFWECSTSVFILLFYNFVLFRNPASTLFHLYGMLGMSILIGCTFLGPPTPSTEYTNTDTFN